MKLIIVRHGETKQNAVGIIQGQSHGELSKKGIEQAKKLGGRLKNEKINCMYTSDLKRAFDTAKLISKHHPKIPLIKRKEIREIDFGDLQNKQKDKIDYYYHKENDPDYYKKNNVESLKKIYNRAKKFIDEITEKHKGETIVIVSHAGIIKSIILVLNKRKYNEINNLPDIKNTGVSVFENDKFTILNSTKHLE